MNDEIKIQKNFEIGQKLPYFRVKIDKKTYEKYNKLKNELNPLHFDKKYAQEIGYDNIVVAGVFLYSFIPKWLIEWIGDVKAIKKITVKFENPVYIDEEIIHKGEIKEIKEENNKKIIYCEYYIEKINGRRVMSGIIKLLLSTK